MIEADIGSLHNYKATAQLQYGYDSAAVFGFQSLPGVLAIFGYLDVSTISCQEQNLD